MKRLWIRGHAMQRLGDIAYHHGTSVTVSPQKASDGGEIGMDSMLVVEVPDAIVPVVESDPWLFIRGKFLADGEEPPYVGNDPKRDGISVIRNML